MNRYPTSAVDDWP